MIPADAEGRWNRDRRVGADAEGVWSARSVGTWRWRACAGDSAGWACVCVATFGPEQCLRNSGADTVADVCTQSHTDVSGGCLPAVFFYDDPDVWPDLFVGTYLRYTPDRNTRCFG